MAVAVVSGAVANKPGNAGAAWTRLSWALGLRRLGFDLLFVEELDAGDAWPEAADWFRRVTELGGLAADAALVERGSRRTVGLSYAEARERADGAALLLNISGHLRDPELLRSARRRVYVDLDPGYTQTWHAAGWDADHIAAHDLHVTVGERIGQPSCRVPADGIRWRPIRQPVCLEDWPVAAGDPGRLTTVASWRGPLGTIDVAGRPRGGKVHEFRRFVQLARRVRQRCEVALDIHPADDRDRERLVEHGWRVVRPEDSVASLQDFRRYVQGSGAEFSVAQGVYVASGCGWFSDRTVRYLASGKPALVQDTGLAERYSRGDGLLTFSTLDEAVEGAARLAADYERHARAARAIAEEHFDSDRVLGELLELDGIAP
jgi:hypothetical protein